MFSFTHQFDTEKTNLQTPPDSVDVVVVKRPRRQWRLGAVVQESWPLRIPAHTRTARYCDETTAWADRFGKVAKHATPAGESMFLQLAGTRAGPCYRSIEFSRCPQAPNSTDGPF